MKMKGIRAKMDQMLMRSKERERLNINMDAHGCLGLITVSRFRLKKQKIMYLMWIYPIATSNINVKCFWFLMRNECGVWFVCDLWSTQINKVPQWIMNVNCCTHTYTPLFWHLGRDIHSSFMNSTSNLFRKSILKSVVQYLRWCPYIYP